MELTQKQLEKNRARSKKMAGEASKNRCVKNCPDRDESGYCFICKTELTAWVSPTEHTFFQKHPDCKL